MSTKDEKTDYVAFAAAAIVVGIGYCFFVVAKDIIWPVLKWMCKRLWSAFKKMVTRKKSPQIKVELPTPDVFKGYTNLAKAKEFKF